jgi:hypothetical protein
MTLRCATAPNTLFQTREELNLHYKSEWHRYNLRRRAAGLGPITNDVFERVRQAAQDQAAQEQHQKPPKQPPQPPPAQPTPEQVAQAMSTFSPNPARCFFDSTSFPDVPACLEHMLANHGFFIPDMDAMTNLEGMLNYCAEKVHVGHICLFCDRSFATGEACVDHMVAKAHCRLAWEFEDQVDEYQEFYDFALIAPSSETRGTMEVDSATGELVLTDPDGSVKRYGPGKDFYRGSKSSSVPAAVTNPSNERALQLYRRSGVDTRSALVQAPHMRSRLLKTKKEKRDLEQRRQGWELANSLQQNWLQKHAVAGTNVGAGHGVHG